MTGSARAVDATFVEDALHELNRRAGALVAEASLLKECLDEVSGDARRPAELLIDDVERLRMFLHRLAAFVKVDRAASQQARSEFDIVEVCREIAARYTRTGSIDIDAPDTAVVTAARETVGAAISLLLENALLHGGGSAKVSIVPAERHVDVEIADRGPGLPAALQSDPFEPFAASRAGLSGTGSGLGLALAHQLLRSVGATLEYRSGAPGARFAFSSPR